MNDGKTTFYVRITPNSKSWIKIFAVDEASARRECRESGWTVHEIRTDKPSLLP
jgi:hypothetical protein